MKAFYFGMKVKHGDELGIVIKPEIKTEWDNEPGLIRWDTNKENDIEDWRGLFGVFVDSGGHEIPIDTNFQFITETGLIKK